MFSISLTFPLYPSLDLTLPLYGKISLKHGHQNLVSVIVVTEHGSVVQCAPSAMCESTHHHLAIGSCPEIF